MRRPGVTEAWRNLRGNEMHQKMAPRLALTALLAWVFAGLAASAAAEPLAVLVSVATQQYLVDRVGGERVHTTVLVGPGRDPHAYEPSPRQMAEASRARVYFRVGVDFEEVWLERIRQSSPSLRVVDQREVVTLRQVEGHRHDGPRHRRAAEPETADAQRQPAAQAPGRADPHVWTSPPLAQRMAAQVRDELTRADPAGAAAYAAGYARLARDLDALDAEIRAALAGAQGRRFMVFHPAWGYFADTYGLTQVPIEQGGKEPGARTLATLIEQARDAGVQVIFVGPRDNPAPAQAIARALGGTVAAVDPLAADYADNLRRVTAAFRAALR